MTATWGYNCSCRTGRKIRIRSARHQERQSGGLRESLKDRRKQCLPEALVDSVAELPWESGEEGTEDEEYPSFRAQQRRNLITPHRSRMENQHGNQERK
jgi:hypothetical protein